MRVLLFFFCALSGPVRPSPCTLSFRAQRCPSECFAVLPSAALSFRVLRCPSERSAVLPSASLSFRVLHCHSERSEESGTREICAGTPQYTLSEASSGSISPQKCRDMRGRPSIYAFYGIIPEHISFGFPSGCPICGPRTS